MRRVLVEVRTIERAWCELARWQSPAKFQECVASFMSPIPSKELFNSPKLSFVLDAWVLAEFAVLKKVERVRLADKHEQWPDGYIDENRKIEVTSVMEPGRRLGDEYRTAGGVVEDDPGEDWHKRVDTIPVALNAGLARKAAKRYGSKADLLVYLNIGEFGIRQKEIESVIAATKMKYLETFDRIHVLWKDKVL